MFNLQSESEWLAEERPVDRGIISGLMISGFLIGAGIIASGHGFDFIDIPSLLIVVGGTLGATLIHFSLEDVQAAWLGVRSVLIGKVNHPQDRIAQLAEFSQRVRREGLLVLEQEAERVDDPFLRKALQLTVDGQQEQDVKRILETEIRSSAERAFRAVQVLETMGATSPAMGLIGTLIGLIQMLSKLNDPATVGPAMSVALLTTFYGVTFANIIFLPFAGKMKNRTEEELLVRAITVEGIISLGRQENPIVLEQRLQSFLPVAA